MFNKGKIKELREKKKMSLADVIYELAKREHRYARQTVGNWELGVTEPKASDVANLAEAFGVPVKTFFE